ncbi:FHA domain-containing protein [Thiohalomonas denitrificans]|uniref:FHA domain-containing protein n=1 Tax=Thiohalomonas denitrificans TaxID=415747 RepID=A0A1G5PKS0_9GAMM|nr:FHA domain-containing protein [Thiohalomonas denitrificans]SCZ50135.1 FHA domain-containing protein [Thiohalomonas denitrificans]
MPKLVITLDGVGLREYALTAQRHTIGRRPDNDILLDDQTVSSEHAAVSMAAEPAVTDLDSTNGTFVNGVQVSKHALKHGDTIRIGQHELRYIDERAQDHTATVVLSAPGTGPAQLEVISGEKSGTVLEVRDGRATIGKPGGQVALVMREADQYRLLPMGKGAGKTMVNGVPVAAEGSVLKPGDEITIAGTRMRFREVPA